MYESHKQRHLERKGDSPSSSSSSASALFPLLKDKSSSSSSSSSPPFSKVSQDTKNESKHENKHENKSEPWCCHKCGLEFVLHEFPEPRTTVECPFCHQLQPVYSIWRSGSPNKPVWLIYKLMGGEALYRERCEQNMMAPPRLSRPDERDMPFYMVGDINVVKVEYLYPCPVCYRRFPATRPLALHTWHNHRAQFDEGDEVSWGRRRGTE